MVTPKKHILIVGAGFGGITCALTLESALKKYGLLKSYQIHLIDKNPYHLYTPALYEIAAIPKNIADAHMLKSIISIPVGEMLTEHNISFIHDEVLSITPDNHSVALQSGQTLEYAHLIIALGSETNYFDIPGAQQYAYAFKCFNDAVRIRNKIEELIQKKPHLSVVIAGAGASGVELGAELSNFICALKKKILRNQTSCNTTITLVEASPEILPGFSKWIVQKARQRLINLGVSLQTTSPITRVDESTVETKNGLLEYDLLIWTAGVRGPRILKEFGVPLTEKGNIAVNEFLEAMPHVYAIGDVAGFKDPRTGAYLVWNVPVAESEGRLVAKNIVRELLGKKKTPFSPLTRYPFILAVGKKFALADLIYIRFGGILGWITKLLVELRYLLFILPLPEALRVWIMGVKLYSSND